MAHAHLVCLLPVRNAAADLPDYLASVARFCDAVVALDDGSVDDTPDLLAASPLVKALLSNPRRDDYRGWDDAANRNRLLAAAAALDPEWIISLDADERIDADDAEALRTFLAGDALPGCAYGFRHVPMRGDGNHFLPRYQWVYRLFAYEPDQRFPTRRLHFPPVPTSIPRSRWVKTTLRIQHLGGMTDERRLARYAKYQQADPDRRYQAEYGHLLHAPAAEELRPWVPRPRDMSVLLAAGEDDSPPADERTDVPVLSAIVIAQNDEATIARTVASVVDQECPEPFEVIVVTSGSDRTASIVREQFPTVAVVELPKPALPGEARNAGLRVARGTYVSFPGSHVELPPGSLAARLRAHRRGYAMVTGVALNGTPTAAGWASYFLDHAEGMPGHPPAELRGAPAHCSYARLPLLEIGSFPEGVRTGEDTAVNRALVRRGYVALRDPAIKFTHRSPCRTPRRLLRHHFKRGRGWGRLLLEEYRERGRLLNRQVLGSRLVHHLPRRLSRIRDNVATAAPEYHSHYRRARPLIVLGALAAWVGLWLEVLRPARGRLAILVGRPIRTLLVIATGGPAPRISVLRLDLVAGEARAVVLPHDLSLTQPDGTDRTLFELVNGPIGPSPDRLQGLVGGAIGMPLDDYLCGPASVVATFAPPLATGLSVDLAPIPSVSWLRHRGISTSMDRWDLVGLASRLRRINRYDVDEQLLRAAAVGPSPGRDLASFAVAIRERLGGRPPGNGNPGGEGTAGVWLP